MRRSSRETILAALPPQAAAIQPVRWAGWGAEDFVRRLCSPRVGLAILAVILFSSLAGEAYAQLHGGEARGGIIATLLKWAPLILVGGPGKFEGFVLNIVVSILAMVIGTVLGVLLGVAQVSHGAWLRRPAQVVTQFFRNVPWLVMLFFTIELMPFQMHIGGVLIPLPAWVKATVGLTLPIMANISEITRGAIGSLPTSQWESAESLAFSRFQTFALIILPQCVKRMTPPWMNWYAILTMETSLVSIVGVSDAMTMTKDALAADGRPEMLIPMYGMLLLFFFVYCYPIARWTQVLERRFAIVT